MLSPFKSAASLYCCDKIKFTESVKGMQISVTAIGVTPKSGPILRKGAKENDLIVVSGDIGSAFMGLKDNKRYNELHPDRFTQDD